MNNDPENIARIQAMIAKKTGTIPAGPLHWDVRDVLDTAPLLTSASCQRMYENLERTDVLLELFEMNSGQFPKTPECWGLLTNERLPYELVAEDLKACLKLPRIDVAHLAHRFAATAPIDELGSFVRYIPPERLIGALRDGHRIASETWRVDLEEPGAVEALKMIYARGLPLPTQWVGARTASPETRNEMINLTRWIVQDGAAEEQRGFLEEMAACFPWADVEPTDSNRGPAPANPDIAATWSRYHPLSREDVEALGGEPEGTFKLQVTTDTLDAVYEGRFSQQARFLDHAFEGFSEHLTMLEMWLRYPGSAWSRNPSKHSLERVLAAFCLHGRTTPGAFPELLKKVVLDYAVELWDVGKYGKAYGNIPRYCIEGDSAVAAQIRLLAENPLRPGFSKVVTDSGVLQYWMEQLAECPTVGPELAWDVLAFLEGGVLRRDTGHVLAALLANEEACAEIAGSDVRSVAPHLPPKWARKLVDAAYWADGTFSNVDWTTVSRYGSDETIRKYILDGIPGDSRRQLEHPRVPRILMEEVGVTDPQAWQLLLSLIDDWEGSLIDLVATAKELHSP